MRRPASIHRATKSTFRPELARGLVEYFQASLERAKQAKASGSTSPVKFPTVVGYCRLIRVAYNTVQTWGRRYPEMRKALLEAATIRLDFSKLELPELVFDTEVQP
jgi:hypothetical protein